MEFEKEEEASIQSSSSEEEKMWKGNLIYFYILFGKVKAIYKFDHCICTHKTDG